jgi:hypothetical protein
MKKPLYDLKGLQEGIISCQENINKLSKVINDENKEIIMEAINKEQDRIKELNELINKHIDYNKYKKVEKCQ